MTDFLMRRLFVDFRYQVVLRFPFTFAFSFRPRLLRLLPLFALFLDEELTMNELERVTFLTYLLPRPDRPKAIEEPDVLEQVGVQPKTSRHCDNGGTE